MPIVILGRKRRGVTRKARDTSARKKARKISNKQNVSPGHLCGSYAASSTPKTKLRGECLPRGSQLAIDSQYDLISSTPIVKRCAHQDQASFMTTPSKDDKNNLLLSSWGLPDQVLAQYSKRGITNLFEWQAECLQLPTVLTGGNLVYSAPTSAGKTLVAELLALKCVLETRRKVIIILPFVSIAHEKLNYLRSILEPQGVRVGGFVGNQSPPGGFAAVDIAICTIEKANSLVNRLLEERITYDLGAVVVDELHMIGDEHRGYLLELLLTKLLYTGRVGKNSSKRVQIIGMSATLPNINVLARWLSAELYQTDYRPTPLHEMVKIGPTLYNTDFEELKEYKRSDSIPGDEDDILMICRERILEGHSVLIFCPTKAWCEKLAATIAEAQAGFLNCSNPAEGEGRSNAVDRHGLVGVCEQLRRTQVGLDHVLEKTIPSGVAFHHAGLTFEEREIVEGAFRQTLVKVLVATSTLSSGVNLPARLVIVRTPIFHRSLLDVLVYKQMVGRAGRKGVDHLGESILMCKPSERAKVVGLFRSAPRLIRSCLCSEAVSRTKSASKCGLAVMKRALLEVVAGGIATTKEEIQLYAACTLYYAEQQSEGKRSSGDGATALNVHLDATLTFLLQNDFICTRAKDVQPSNGAPGEEFYPTQLGAATIASALSPDEALVVFKELRKARRNFVLENELHTIYLVTPVYIQEQWPNIDWYKYLCLWERLPADMKHVSDTLGVRESFLAQAIQGRIPERTDLQREAHRVHRRFFTALALHDLVHEAPIRHVARRYGATKGLLQTLQSAAGTFAGMVTVFCSKLGWSNLELLLSQFQSRLLFGVERELCDLVKISLLNGFRARVLYNSGYHTLAALAAANPALVETALRNAVPFKSYKLASDEGDDHSSVAAVRNTWCEKLRKGMTESEAAVAIVNDARAILSSNLNFPLSAWDRQQPHPFPSPPKPVAIQESDGAGGFRGSGVTAATGGRRVSPVAIQGSDGTGGFQGSGGIIAPGGHRRSPTAGHLQVELAQKKPHRAACSKSPLPPRQVLSNLQAMPARHFSPRFHPATGLAGSIRPCRDHNVPASRKVNRQATLDLSPICVLGNIDDQPGVSMLPEELQVAKELSFSDSFDKSNHIEGLGVESLPCTVPDSLSCSTDVSMSFSFQTLAMIDAVCDAVKLSLGSPGVTSKGSPGVPSKGSPGVTSKGSPGVTSKGSPGVTSKGSPGVTSKGSPGVTSKGSPGVTSKGSPGVTSKGSPGVTSKGSPGVTSKGSPGVTSKGSPSKGSPGVTSNGTLGDEACKQLSLSSCISLAFDEYLPDESGDHLGTRSLKQTPLKPADSDKCVPETPSQFQPSGLNELSSLCSSQLSQSGLTLINVTSNRVLFDTFVAECLEQEMVAFSVAYTNIHQSDGIGSIVVKPKSASGIPVLPTQKEQVVGVTFSWGGMDVYFVSLSQPCTESEFHSSADSIPLADRVAAVRTLFERENRWEKVVAYDMKKHAKYLALSCGAMPASSLVLDPLVADWMLNPDAKEKTIHRMVLQYLPDQPLLSGCEDYEEMPLSSLATNCSDPEMQASAECILAYMLSVKLEALLEAEGLHDPYLNLEMPSLLVLAKVELNGIGFSPEECTNQRDILQKRVSELEREAYTLAGHTFSLTSPEDVASVLFLELKLPPGSAGSLGKQRTLGAATRRAPRKRVQHLSTAKDVLEKLKPMHPLPGVVLEWRRISATMSKTVYPLFKEAVAHEQMDCFRVHARVQIHTATGRVSVADPSLQMVPKEFDIGSRASTNPTLLSDSQYLEVQDLDKRDKVAAPSSVHMRSVFQPFPGGVFLTADYSQLELRILAHMSGDRKLKQFLNSEGDVFKMIAGEWLGIPATAVSDKERQNTKQICYGMIYGIGAKALGEQMGISDNEASQFMETFRSKYPTVKKFISKTVQSCRDTGFVTTLLGRKRFLPGIHSTNVHARSQAERQALNSTVQGSAADLVKTAMVNIDEKVAERYGFSATCLLPPAARGSRAGQGSGDDHAAYLVLQLHDELLYEVREGDLEGVAKIVQQEMENALELSVKFPVKIKTGSSWGRLEPIQL